MNQQEKDGIWYQTAEHFADSKNRDLQQEIRCYFAEVGAEPCKEPVELL